MSFSPYDVLGKHRIQFEMMMPAACIVPPPMLHILRRYYCLDMGIAPQPYTYLHARCRKTTIPQRNVGYVDRELSYPVLSCRVVSSSTGKDTRA